MPDLTLITTCMGRLAHLRQTLPAAVAQPGCTCIVVDYSCPERSGDWVEQHHPAVRVVRVPGQARFNPSRARNAGAILADTAWLGFFDADIVLAPDFVERLRPMLQAGTYHVAEPWQSGLTGTVFCARHDFERIGGYDETFAGWGEEDMDLCDRLRLSGCRPQGYPAALVTQLRHDDALRTQYHDLKSPRQSQAINMLYRHAKLDLMRLLGRPLSAEERRGLHAEAAQAVQEATPRSEWRIMFRHARTLLGQDVTATLVYALNTGAAP